MENHACISWIHYDNVSRYSPRSLIIFMCAFMRNRMLSFVLLLLKIMIVSGEYFIIHVYAMLFLLPLLLIYCHFVQ